MKKLLAFSLVAVALCAQDKVDLAVIQRIKTEAFQNSKVMDHLFWITDVYGPRLTGSPGFTAAANWTVKRLKEYGIDDAATEPWGKFGRSWRLTKFSISIQEPEYAPLIGFPLAWSADTKGPRGRRSRCSRRSSSPIVWTEEDRRGTAKVFSGTEGQAAGKDRAAGKAARCDARYDGAVLALFRCGLGEGGRSSHAAGAAAVRSGEGDPAGEAWRIGALCSIFCRSDAEAKIWEYVKIDITDE